MRSQRRIRILRIYSQKPKGDICFQSRFTMNVFLNIFPKTNLHPFETFEISFKTHVGDTKGVSDFGPKR